MKLSFYHISVNFSAIFIAVATFLSPIIIFSQGNKISVDTQEVNSLLYVINQTEGKHVEPNKEDTLLFQSYSELASIFRKQKPELGLKYTLEALKVAEKLKSDFKTSKFFIERVDEYLTALYFNLGYLYEKFGAITLSIDYYYKSLNLSLKYNDLNALAYGYNNLGTFYSRQRDSDMAIEYLNKTIEIRKSQKNTKELTNSYGNLAAIYVSSGDTARGLDYYNKCVALNLLNDSTYEMGTIYLKMAPIYYHNNPARSLGYYQKALKIFELHSDQVKIASTLNLMGRFYLTQNDLTKAKIYGERAYKLAQDLGFPSLIQGVSNLLKKIYLKKRDYKKAFYFVQTENQMKDSIQNNANFRMSQKKQMKFDYERQSVVDSISHSNEIELKEIEMKGLEVANENSRNIIVILLIGAGLTIIFVLFLIRLFIQKKRANLILEQQKIEIVKHNKENQEIKDRMMKEKLKYKNNQLTTMALDITRKQDYTEQIIDRLKKIKKKSSHGSISEINELMLFLRNELNIELNRNSIDQSINDVSDEFYIKLNNSHPNLTKSDKQLCALIRLGLSNKEIAVVKNISPTSIKSIKNKLKHKLELTVDDKMTDYLSRI